ncbi:MAG: DUF4912 domain-containing protein [Treponema sp.]|jgi:hypothetical protein|nr:DUF4912 domain-containing protein [Treponema sp.]
MNQARLVRPYLDSLTTQDLARIADNCGIDIPPNLERIFIIEELLDYARMEEDEEEETLAESPDYLETAPIPRHYNITFIDVMIRDPLWVFVFWEVKEYDRDIFENDPDFSGYYLRVIPAGEGPRLPKDQFFMVQVGPDDTARYLGFSEYPALPERGFRVELFASFGGRNEILAVSRVFRLPVLPGKVVHSPDAADSSLPSLVSLSGLNDFYILRDTDRRPQRRYSCNES